SVAVRGYATDNLKQGVLMLQADHESEVIDEKPMAPESLKTRRAREKLLKQWEIQRRQITPKAIAKKNDEIRKWIADNAKDRVPIKEKIELFNQNQNAAAISRKVQLLSEKLKLDMQQIGKVFEQPKGQP
ncbi:MAG: hypothetical protein V4487_05815, partial [Chlamydiota bacterium]